MIFATRLHSLLHPDTTDTVNPYFRQLRAPLQQAAVLTGTAAQRGVLHNSPQRGKQMAA